MKNNRASADIAEDLETNANTLSFESQKDSDLSICIIMQMDRKYRTVLLLYNTNFAF